MRAVNIIYGQVQDEHSMLRCGGDLYVEVSPKNWVRFADLPMGHAAIESVNRGELKAGIQLSNGEMVTTLNAYDAGHCRLMRQAGLTLQIPRGPEKQGTPYWNKMQLDMLQRIKNCMSTLQWLKLEDEISASVMQDEDYADLTRKCTKIKKEMQEKMKEFGSLNNDDLMMPANIRTNDGEDFIQANRWFRELFRADVGKRQFAGTS